MTEKRPTLAKKHTRTTSEHTDASLEIGAEFFIDGEHYKITLGDMSARDTLELRRQAGMSIRQVLGGLLGDDFDLHHVAAVIWLSRFVNGGERDLTFDEVAESVGYDVMEKIRQGAADERKRVADEAKAAKKTGTKASADPEA